VPAPVLDGLESTTGGEISAAITAGGGIGEITAHGKLDGVVHADQTIGRIWAGGDVTKAITAGTGNMTIVAWGDVTGDVTAPGDVHVGAGGDLAGKLNADFGSVTAHCWGNIGSDIDAHSGADIWALGDVTGNLASAVGTVQQFVWGKSRGSITHKGDTFLISINGVENLNLLGGAPVVGQALLTLTALDVLLNGLTFIGAVNGNLLAYTSGDANLDVSQSNSVTVIAWGNATGTVKSDGTVSIMSLGDADLAISGQEQGSRAKSVAIESASVKGTYAADSISVNATGDFDATISARDGAKLRIQGTVEGTIASEGVTDVFASGDVSASISGKKAALVTAWGAITGTVTSNEGVAVVEAFGNVEGDVHGTHRVELVTWGAVSGNISSSDGSVNLFAAREVGGSIVAGKSVSVEAGENVLAEITGGTKPAEGDERYAVTVTSQGDIHGDVKLESRGDVIVVATNIKDDGIIQAVDGDVSAEAMYAFEKAVHAERDALIYAGSLDGISVTAVNGTASITTQTAADVTVTAKTDASIDASVESPEDIEASITAGGSASVFSGRSIAGPITASNGHARVDAGEDITGEIVAGQDAVINAIGDVSGDITAGRDVSVSAFGGLTGQVVAMRNASVFVRGNIDATVTGGQDTVVTTLGDVTAAIEATEGHASVTATGEVSGDVIGGAGVDIYSGEDITGDVTSGGNVSLTAWGNITNSVDADGSILASASGDIDITVEAGGSVELSSAQSLDATVTAGGNVRLDAFEELTAQVNAGGAVAISGYADTEIDVDAEGDVDVFAVGTLAADVNSSGGDVSLLAVGDATVNVTAGDDVSVEALANLTTTSIVAGDYAQVSAWGTAFIGNLEADGGAFLFAAGALQGGTFNSSSGSIAINGGGSGTIFSLSAPNISIAMLGSIYVSIEDSGDVEIIAGEHVGGFIDATGTVDITALRNHTAHTHAGVDASVWVVGTLAGEVRADRDVRIGSYGPMSDALTVEAGRNIVYAWSRGGIGGLFIAGNAIGEVLSYGPVDATFVAGTGDTGLSDYGRIEAIEAWGPIDGTATAATGIGRIVSGKGITIDTSHQPAVVSANDRGVYGEYPEDPQVSLAPMGAYIAEARREVGKFLQEVALSRTAASRQLMADRASLEASNSLLASEFATAYGRATSDLVEAVEGLNRDWLVTQERTAYKVNEFGRTAIDVELALTNLQSYLNAANAQQLQILKGRIEANGQRVIALAAAEAMTLQLMMNSKAIEQTSELLRLQFDKENRATEWQIAQSDIVWKLVKPDLDKVQIILDIVGIFDPTGIVDGVNGVIHLLRGNKLEAAQSFVAMLPGVGDVIGKGTKYGVQIGRALCLTSRIGNGVISGFLAYEGYRDGDWTNLVFAATSLLRFLRAACFEAGTQVVVGVNADGTYQLRSIEELQVGDIVLTKDQFDPSGELIEGRVTQVHQSTVYGLHLLEFTDEEIGNIELIRATAEHPFYVDGIGWVGARDLVAGMRVQNPDGTWSVVTATLYEAHDQGITVYSIEVEGGHTYFVADAEGDVTAVWVHNRCNPLRARMGPAPFAGAQAAHIVPVGAFRNRSSVVQAYVRDAQAILRKHRIDLDTPVNGFWAGVGHLGTHTNKYLIAMSRRIQRADFRGGALGVVAELHKLKADILAGKFL